MGLKGRGSRHPFVIIRHKAFLVNCKSCSSILFFELFSALVLQIYRYVLSAQEKADKISKDRQVSQDKHCFLSFRQMKHLVLVNAEDIFHIASTLRINAASNCFKNGDRHYLE